MKIIEINGSHGEAGGQILRTSLALSAYTGKPFKISNIRKSRPIPGLQPQHMKAVQAAAALCSADTKGVEKHSMEVEFKPNKIKSGIFEFDIKTAGSVTLLLQALLPICLKAKEPIKIIVKGGTDVQYAPPIKYFQHVFAYYMRKIGIDTKIHVKKHGFYPKGGGKVLLEYDPKNSSLKPINIQQRGILQRIDIHSTASETLEKAKVAERQLTGFMKNIGKLYSPLVKNKFIEYVSTSSIGSVFHCHAHFEKAKVGASWLGKPGLRAENVGMRAAQNLIEQIKQRTPLDEYMEDQIIPYMALSTMKHKKSSIIAISHMTKHTETNIWTTEQFLPVKFEIGKNVLECNYIA
ncbi:RNA 3'-phosphate cyclase [archaeon]|nr:RNA 3'-phosphate cyclase [archaeon]|tara:strand:+ start:620 stop:1669 length:1050 start_codon:yes stop_codon:yes gene_type:complete